MKHKFKVLAAIASIAVVCLCSCQPKYDPMESISAMADKNIPGVYSVLYVDTANMMASIKEYVVSADNSGSYKLFKVGEGQNLTTTAEESFTWKRGDYVQNFSFIELMLKYADRDETIKWGSAAFFIGDEVVERGSRSTSIKSVYNEFPNVRFMRKDSAFFSSVDTVTTYYLEWNQAKGAAMTLTNEEYEAKKAYFDQQWVKDTIAWYNETFNKKVPDSIRVGKDNGDTKVCVYYIATEVEKKEAVETHLADKEVTNSMFFFNRDEACKDMGEYCFHYFKQDSTHYLNNNAGYAKDSLYRFEVESWCVGLPTSPQDFDIVARGKLTHTSWEQVNGVKTEIVNEVKTNHTIVIPISSFYVGEEATCYGKKHLPVQN